MDPAEFMEATQSVVRLGRNPKIDQGVLIGYRTGREIDHNYLTIGDDAIIRSGTVIYEASKIGNRLQTGHGVVIREQNMIGDDVWIWSNSVIDYGCRIGNGVRVHNNVVISQFCILEDDVFISAGTVLANDKYPLSKTEDLRGVNVKRGARIGVNCSILPGITIGEDALVGAGSVVTKDVPPGSVVYGNPARHRRVGL